MRCSIVVGVLSATKEIYSEEQGETLYLATLNVRGSMYPVVGYDTALKDGIEGKVAVTCYLKSDKRRGALFTYLRALTIVPSAKDVEETSSMVVQGLLVKKNELTADLVKGTEVLTFIMRYRDNDNNQNIIHAVAKGKMARLMDKKELGQLITVSGVLWAKQRTLELEIREVE